MVSLHSRVSKLSLLAVRRSDQNQLISTSYNQSRFFSANSSLVPRQQQIANLILDQKSPDQALETFAWASRIPNFTHTPSTYRALIHKLCTFRRFDIAEEMLDKMPETIGLAPDDDIFITLVRGYGRARKIKQAIRVLDLVPKFGNSAPSLKLLNTVLDVLVKENIDIAREFFRRKMMGGGMKCDSYTYAILMKGFCLTNRIGDGFKLLQVMKTRGVETSVVVYNTLIYALCKNGKIGRARSLMREMKEFSDVSFNIMISGYCNENNIVQALVMLEKCFDRGFLPDIITLTKVVEILCEAARTTEAVEVLDRIEEKGGTLDAQAYNTLIKGFVKVGKVRTGHGFLKQMEMKGCLPNTETYNILISGFCESRMFDSALDVFHEMARLGVRWDFSTFDSLIYGLCSDGKLVDGIKIFKTMMAECKNSYITRISPYNSILYGIYKSNSSDKAIEFLNYMRNMCPRAADGSLRIIRLCQDDNNDTEEAKRIFDEMCERGISPSAVVYSSMINGLAQNGDMKEAVELTNEMMLKGYFPVESTLNALISGFCRQGKTKSALRFMDDLKVRGYLPDSGSYGHVIINALCDEERYMIDESLFLFMEMVEKGIITSVSCHWSVLVEAVLKGKSRANEHEQLLLSLMKN